MSNSLIVFICKYLYILLVILQTVSEGLTRIHAYYITLNITKYYSK